MAATLKVKVRVREGWAVYDGKTQRGQGETLEVDRDRAEQWETAGWVERVTSRKPPAAT